MDKYLSVITNFGCHYKCPYCIVKENGLKIPRSTIEGLANLSKEIEKHQVNWVSVSGGGDPLWNYTPMYRWWIAFMKQIPPNVNLELHTSILDCDDWKVYYAFDRVVYHLHDIQQISKIMRYSRSQKVRVVFVVTPDFTPGKIQRIVQEVKSNPHIDELSFRQMVDDHYQITHYCEDYLKAGHQKDWWYIEQNDYNLYYCEGKVTTKFEDFKNG